MQITDPQCNFAAAVALGDAAYRRVHTLEQLLALGLPQLAVVAARVARTSR